MTCTPPPALTHTHTRTTTEPHAKSLSHDRAGPIGVAGPVPETKRGGGGLQGREPCRFLRLVSSRALSSTQEKVDAMVTVSGSR